MQRNNIWASVHGIVFLFFFHILKFIVNFLTALFNISIKNLWHILRIHKHAISQGKHTHTGQLWKRKKDWGSRQRDNEGNIENWIFVYLFEWNDCPALQNDCCLCKRNVRPNSYTNKSQNNESKYRMEMARDYASNIENIENTHKLFQVKTERAHICSNCIRPKNETTEATEC